MPYLTKRKNLKLQLSPGLVASYDIQPGNGVGLFWDTKHTHIFTYLLTYPGLTQGIASKFFLHISRSSQVG